MEDPWHEGIQWIRGVHKQSKGTRKGHAPSLKPIHMYEEVEKLKANSIVDRDKIPRMNSVINMQNY